MPELVYRNVEFLVRDLDEAEGGDMGICTGYASTFDDVNEYYDEQMVRGCFKKTIRDYNGAFPVLLDHMTRDRAGITSKAQEDKQGLYVEMELLIGDVRAAKERWALMKQGAKYKRREGMSIGFEPIVSEYDEKSGLVKRKEVKLWEISLTAFPSLPSAQVGEMRNALALLGKFGTLTPEQEALARRLSGSERAAELGNGAAGDLHSVRELLDRVMGDAGIRRVAA